MSGEKPSDIRRQSLRRATAPDVAALRAAHPGYNWLVLFRPVGQFNRWIVGCFPHCLPRERHTAGLNPILRLEHNNVASAIDHIGQATTRIEREIVRDP